MFISGVLDVIIIVLGLGVTMWEGFMLLKAFYMRHKAEDAVDELDMAGLRRYSRKHGNYVSWHSMASIVITLFPLFGMLGTVLALLSSVDSDAGDTSNFLSALSSTMWGIVASIVTKAVEALWVKILMDIDTMITPYLEAVTTGNTAEKYYRKGLKYEKGDGTDLDLEEAYHCFHEAAKLGSAEAQYKMGEYNEKGLIADRDEKEAEYWYHKAYDQGIEKAEIALRRIYSHEDLRTGKQ